MRTSDTIKAIAPALVEAQKAIETAHKTAANPFFKSKYADLPEVIAAVKGPLNANGIAFLQGVDMVDGLAVIATRLIHASGEWIESLTPVYCKEPNNPQALGSGITYSKRYALQAICGLPTDDDDGEGAMRRGEQAQKPQDKALKPIDAATIQSPAWSGWIRNAPSVDGALATMRSQYAMTPELESLVRDIHEAP